jgi:hypothetical protein
MRRSRAEWEKTVAEFEASGERHVAFCERRGVSVHAFRDWLHRFRQERSAGGGVRSAKKSVQMVPVRVRDERRAPAVDDVVEVLVRGALVRVRIGQAPRYLAELAAALTERC